MKFSLYVRTETGAEFRVDRECSIGELEDVLPMAARELCRKMFATIGRSWRRSSRA